MFEFLKKFKKLLCFLFISIFMLGFGGESVGAVTVNSRGTLNFRSLTYFQHLYFPSNNLDVYCLNSSYDWPKNKDLVEMPGLISDYKKDGVINILKTSEELDLSDSKRYYVTQAALWYHLNGTGTNGITQNFYNWIMSSDLASSFDKLIKSVSNEIVEPSISVSASDHYVEYDDAIGYLLSKDFSIESKGLTGDFKVSVMENNSSGGTCILYNDKCEKEQTVSSGSKFKIRIDKPADEIDIVSGFFTVDSLNEGVVYDVKTYGGFSSSGFQDIAILTSEKKKISRVQSVIGIYDFEDSTDVEIQKVDAKTGDKVAGATLAITDKEGNMIGEYQSTGAGEANPKIKLVVGDYLLSEVKAPVGYAHNDEKVLFSVVDDNGTIKVKQNDKIVDNATISFSNEKIRIKFKKVNSLGQPVPGVKFKITSFLESDFDEPNAQLCAITDENGFLTKECSGDDKTSNVNANGEYTLGLDFGSSSDYYMIEELCENENCKQYMYSNGKSVAFPGGPFNFFVKDSGASVGLINPYLSITEDDKDSKLLILTMENQNYIDISKSDITTSEEVPGATLIVTDPSVTGDNVIAEWVSTDKPKTIEGIDVNHRYRLEEKIAPEGYVKISTSIDFEMAADGTVKVFDPETGNEIKDLASSNYKLLVPNDTTKVSISKTDIVTGEEIAGAKIKICTASEYKKSGNDCLPSNDEWSWESEAKPHYINKLPVGDYYLIETVAPVGYVKKTSAVSFTVKEETGVQQVIFTNQPTKVTIAKKNQVTGERLEGAKFKLLNASDRSVVVDSEGKEYVWSSSKTEDKVIYGLPAGEYILIETMPAENYQEGMIIDGETMSEYKFVVSDQEDDVNIDVYVEVLNAPNTGISTINIFAIGGLMIFFGYQLMKSYRRKA